MPQFDRESSVENVPMLIPGVLRRTLAKLVSSAHLVLSGTTASILVIIFLGSLFVFVALRNHHGDEIRARTVQLTRLSSLIENDIAELENYHRGFLLTHRSQHVEPFQERRTAMKKRLEELNGRLLDNPVQRKRVIKAEDIVLRWADQVAQPAFLGQSAPSPASDTSSALTLSNASLDQARWILQSLKDEEQILLSQRVGEQEMATQSTQILDSLPKLERAVIEMNKEKRGFLLTNDNGFLETYHRSVENFYRYHAYLTILAGDAPRRTQLLNDIRSNLERWLSSCALPEINSKQQGRDINAIIDNDQGEQLINKIQRAIAEFQRNELASYDAGSIAAVRHRIWSTIGLLTLVLVVALLISSNTYSLALVRRNLSKLGAAEIRMRAIIENILDGMIIIDRAGTITLMNPAAEKLFGCSKHEMLNQAFLTLVPQAYNTEADLQLVDWGEFTKRTGTTVLAVGRTRKYVTFPIEISLAKMTVDQCTLYVAMIRDVTERKRFGRGIAAEKENLAVTLRSIGDGVITTDVQGKIIMINQAAEALTGWTAEEAKGQPLKSVFKISIDLAAQTRAQRSTYRNEAYSLLKLPSNATLVSRDGTEHLIEQVVSPIRDRRNEVAGVVLVFRDIIEREHKQLGLLAGGIAHDFNNLLTAIMGNISLASLLIPATDEMTTRLADAKNDSMRARDLAQQLLTFARGGAPIKKTTSLTRLVQDTVSFCLRGSQSRSECDLEDKLWPTEIDPGQISQVIATLVVNAEQAMPTGGTLHVTCENFRQGSAEKAPAPDLPPGEFVKITIRDEGGGIPEQNLKRIFDPYFTTKPKGNGLGLATAYSIVKHHKGLITVESEVNKGSTFTLYLPAAAHVAVPEETGYAGVKELSGTGRVLIVDDEEVIRTLVEFTLTHLGYKVCSAATALEGVELYRQKLQAGERFDCVILDLTLPGGMGGRDALKLLLEIDPSVNAIVSSGYAMDATMSHYQDFGFRGVITKPYEAAELGRTVREVIESGRIKLVPDLDLQAVG